MPISPTRAAEDAAAYAAAFASLGDPVRVQLLHVLSAAPAGVPVGELAGRVGVDEAACEQHLSMLAGGGFVLLDGDGARVDPAVRTRLPNAVDVVLGVLGGLGAAPLTPAGLPTDVEIRAFRPDDWPDVRRIYAEGIATGAATFETEVPDREALDAAWLPGQRWVAEADGTVAGWAAVKPTSGRAVYAGVAETSVYVGDGFRGRGVGRALVHQQVTAADAGGLWTLQAVVVAGNRAGVALHRSAGFRMLGVRDRVGWHRGAWCDTVVMERRSLGVAIRGSGRGSG